MSSDYVVKDCSQYASQSLMSNIKKKSLREAYLMQLPPLKGLDNPILLQHVVAQSGLE